MKIREQLRAARRQAGVTQRELARRAGVPQSTVARIESGILEPRADTAERIAAALGLSFAVEPRFGEGVDRGLIRRYLRLSPRERIEYGAATGRALRRLRSAAEGTG